MGSPFQRSLVLIGAALALPIIVLVVLQVVFVLGRERDQVQRAAMARAAQIQMLSDARLEADFAAMRVLGSVRGIQTADWPTAYQRTREIAALNPQWRNVILSDPRSHEEIFNLRRPFTARRQALMPPIAAVIDSVRGPTAGAVYRDGPGCPCVYVHMPVNVGGAPRYLLTVAIDPHVFQAIMLADTPAGSVSGIVDRDGNFIARSLHYDARVGTPGTALLRQEVAGGRAQGLYRSRTWEGFESFTAYQRSATTGWSSHMAIASSLIARPATFSFLAVAVGSLIALGLGAVLIFYALNDLAQRRRAEERIAQAQKLEAIGQLTGGVAHDFNNLLTVIIGGLGMLLKRIQEPQTRAIAEGMLEAAQRGDKLTKQLLAFSRGQQLEIGPVDLHALVNGMQDLLRRSIDHEVVLDYSLHPDARWAMTDANQIELAILNLAINARDAMPGGGRVQIAVRPARHKRDCIELSVSDTGMGMPRDVAERAMEPFFTTKPAGKGTGLGLAQVYGAVRQSGGAVEIDTAPQRGTTIRLVLPRAAPPAEAPAPAEDAAPAEQAPVHAGRTVLVVDDEPGVRAFMAETLREAGYDAHEASDVGVALMRLDSDPPDLLLTDYSMPGMNGLELAERGRAKTADLKVLIVSGYADAEALEASAARPALLRKPFDERELIQAVETVLAA